MGAFAKKKEKRKKKKKRKKKEEKRVRSRRSIECCWSKRKRLPMAGACTSSRINELQAKVARSVCDKCKQFFCAPELAVRGLHDSLEPPARQSWTVQLAHTRLCELCSADQWLTRSGPSEHKPHLSIPGSRSPEELQSNLHHWPRHDGNNFGSTREFLPLKPRLGFNLRKGPTKSWNR